MVTVGPDQGIAPQATAAIPPDSRPAPEILPTPVLAMLGGRCTRLRTAVIVTVTAAVLASLAYWVGTTDITGVIRLLTPGHLLAVLGLTLILPFAHALRLQVALASAGTRLGFWR